MIIELRGVKMNERTIVMSDGDDDAWGEWMREGVRMKWGKGIAAVVV